MTYKIDSLLKLADNNFIELDASKTLQALKNDKSFEDKNYILVRNNSGYLGILQVKTVKAMLKSMVSDNHVTLSQLVIQNFNIIGQAEIDKVNVRLMIELEINYLILVSTSGVANGIFSIYKLIKHNISYQKIFYDSDDLRILSEIRDAESLEQFMAHTKEAIICYEPEEPIDITLSSAEILRKVEKAIVYDCNSYYTEVFKIKREDIVGKKKLQDRVSKNAINRALLQFITQNNFKANNVESLEYDSLGEPKWFSNNIFFEISDGYILKIWSRKAEITQSKKLEEKYAREHVELVDINEIFRAIFCNTHDAIFYGNMSKEDQFRILAWNDVCEKQTGVLKEDAIDKKLSDIFPSGLSEHFLSNLNKCFNHGETIVYEDKIQFSTGRYYLKITLIPLKNIENKIFRIIGIAHNLTPYILNEIRLLRYNSALKAINLSRSMFIKANSANEMFMSITKALGSSASNYLYVFIAKPDLKDKSSMVFFNKEGRGQIMFDQLYKEYSKKIVNDGVLASARRLEPTKLSLSLNNNLFYFACFPIQNENSTFHVLGVLSDHEDAFDDFEIELLGNLTQDLMYRIKNLELQNAYNESVLLDEMQALRINTTLEEAISALASLAERRDPYTAGHQQRVSDLAEKIAINYGLSTESIHWLKLAALIHDIGKVQVPVEILSKPSVLTPTEYEIVKEHPLAGYEVLKNIDFPGPVAEIVYQHHEYLDGTGYPNGLKGDAIRVESRILTIADIMEAMSSHRPYRPGKGIDAALKEIQKLAHTKLDPELVAICTMLFENGYKFPDYSSFLTNSLLEQSLGRD